MPRKSRRLLLESTALRNSSRAHAYSLKRTRSRPDTRFGELHQSTAIVRVVFRLSDKASLNFPICVKDSQKGCRKCAFAGPRFTQYSQCFAALHDEANARECDLPLMQSHGVGHAKIHDLKERFHAKRGSFCCALCSSNWASKQLTRI